MERFEPAALDLWGATWGAGETYALQPGARRYEFYERNFAGVVCTSFRFCILMHPSPCIVLGCCDAQTVIGNLRNKATAGFDKQLNMHGNSQGSFASAGAGYGGNAVAVWTAGVLLRWASA